MQNKPKDIVVKIGITPSEAPFRITCLRTFLYINAIAENNAFKGGRSKVIFQIDDTNPAKRKHSNEEIIEFYKQIGILPFKYSEVEITCQTDLKDECEKYFKVLDDKEFIIHNEDGTCAFNINKYIEVYDSTIEVKDLVMGNINFDAKNLTDNGEILIRRSNGSFLYNFSSAIDIIHWRFTTLIRGNNKMSSAAFQNMFINSLDEETPDYFHLPLLLEEKKENEFGVNARSSIKDLFKNGFSYMPVLNYILGTGYGDQTDHYNSLEEFNETFEIEKLHKTNSYFDFNIMKKQCNRFFQQDMSYEEYYNQLSRHIELMGWNENMLKYSNIGYEHRLSPEKINQLYTQLDIPHFDEIYDENTKNKILTIIESLLIDYQGTINTLLIDKNNKKESLKLVKYILSGYFNGLTCDVYKNCYSEEEYQNRLRLVKEHISKGE